MKIPRHEPEVIAAGARRYPASGDEKVATTSLNPIHVCGVKIESRYGKANELEEMSKFILDLPGPWRHKVAGIWCDSKAGACYSVLLRDWEVPGFIGRAIGASALKHGGGHNGIFVRLQDKNDPDNMFGVSSPEFCVDPDWGDLYEDYPGDPEQQ